MKIGFIGLGTMGEPMARNLVHAGFGLNILSKSKKSYKFKNEESVRFFDDNKTLAANSQVIITMLPNSDDVIEVLNGANGVLAGIRENSIFVDMSTISPSVSINIFESFKKLGVHALDAPVSGGDVGAKSGSLSIMVGGEKDTYEEILPIFQSVGSNVVYMGEAGSGQMTKACNQIIVALNILGVSEAFNLARDAELDLKRLREALLGGFAQSRVLDLHGQRIIDENFEAGFRVYLHRKDLNIILNEGYLRSLPLLGTGVIANLMDSMISTGKGSLDHSAVFAFLKTLSKNL